jgi:hypothetical protein
MTGTWIPTIFSRVPSFKFSNSKVQPFARVMAGGAHTRFEAEREFTGVLGTTSSSFEVGATDFAAAAGGGIDIQVGERMKLRVVQFDWTPVFLRDRTVQVLGTNGRDSAIHTKRATTGQFPILLWSCLLKLRREYEIQSCLQNFGC